MTARDWLAMRGVELLAALFVAGLLIGGLAAGVPLLRSRIPEVMLYSAACVAAVILRSVLDVLALGILRLGHLIQATTRWLPAPIRHAA